MVIFILVISSAVLVHDVSERASDMSMRIASFPLLLTEFCCYRSKNRASVRLSQRSTNVQSMRKKLISLKHVQFCMARYTDKVNAIDF